jgi:DNA-binding protein HU-beta
MKKADLVDVVAQQKNLQRQQVEITIDALIDAIADGLSKGERIDLRGFGAFAVRESAARTGRNPQTGAPIEIAARRVPTFKAGKELRDKVNRPVYASRRSSRHQASRRTSRQHEKRWVPDFSLVIFRTTSPSRSCGRRSPGNRSSCGAFASHSIAKRVVHEGSPSWRPPPTMAPRLRSRSSRGASCRGGRSSWRRRKPNRRGRVLPAVMGLARHAQVGAALVARGHRAPAQAARRAVPGVPVALAELLAQEELRAALPGTSVRRVLRVVSDQGASARRRVHAPARALPAGSVPKRNARPGPSPRSASGATGAGTARTTSSSRGRQPAPVVVPRELARKMR